jgi:hypothetical protein
VTGLSLVGSGPNEIYCPAQIEDDDLPNTTSSQAYAVQGKVTVGDFIMQYGIPGSFGIWLEEIKI